MSNPKHRSNARTATVQMAPPPADSAGESGFRRMDETDFLLSSRENARRLRRSIADVKAGKVFERDLIECD